MSQIVCVGCHRHFTHAGYSRHLSMTTRRSCRALYDGHLDRSMVHNFSSASGGLDPGPGGVSGPEAGNIGEYPC